MNGAHAINGFDRADQALACARVRNLTKELHKSSFIRNRGAHRFQPGQSEKIAHLRSHLLWMLSGGNGLGRANGGLLP